MKRFFHYIVAFALAAVLAFPTFTFPTSASASSASCTGGYCSDTQSCRDGYDWISVDITCGTGKFRCCPDPSESGSGSGGGSGSPLSCPCMSGSCPSGTTKRRKDACLSGYECCSTSGGSGGSGSGGSGGSAGEEVTEEVLNNLNPLKKYADEAVAEELSTPGGIISRFLTMFAFPIAGLILFIMLVWGGFEMLLGAADKKSIDAGKQRITAALIGFLLLFASYWLAQIIEMIFGLDIV